MSDSIFCQDCGKTLMQSKGEYDHGCLDCAGSVQSEKLFWLRKEIQKLKADREVLVWALEFYADPLSYRTIETKLDHYPTILNECEHINHRLCGGKRARQALKSIGEIE